MAGFSVREALAEDLLKSAVTAVGDAAYRWSIEDGVLTWSAGASALLGISDISTVATHRDFATRLLVEGPGRYELICRSREKDKGTGVPYELEYQIRDDFGGVRWVEDRGVGYVGSDGSPALAVGVLRALDERHNREAELIRLSIYDGLTGLLTRVRMKEALTEAMIASQRGRQNSAFLLIAVDNL